MPAKDDKALYPILTQAGIKRDGTSLDGNFYSDGLWCRFRNGRPKKIGGFRDIANLNIDTIATGYPRGPIRGLYPIMVSPQVNIHAMHGYGVNVITSDQNGVGGSIYDRTPAGWAISSDIQTFSSGALYSSPDATTVIAVHAARDLTDITSDVSQPIWYGVASATGALITTTKSVSGGMCILGPYIFAFGANGEIANCDTNKPAVWAGGFANQAFPASTKVVAGMPLRGGSNAPAGIFWSLAEIIRVLFVGGSVNWRYDIMTDQSSILAKDAVVEYDGVYYWPGIDRFLMYNGVMSEVPNAMNQDFFFDNINLNYRNKCWGMRIARWGEIWWFFPKGTATECNWAVVYNVREKTWYDTPITRSAGFPARELPLTIMADSSPNTNGSGHVGYRLFRHEFGVDSIIGESQTAIDSYFETSDLGFASGGPAGTGIENPNCQTRIVSIEPDFRQVKDMSVTVRGQSYAQDSTVVDSTAPVTFSPTSAIAKVDLGEQRRLLRLKFETNALGGDYHMGKPLLHLEPGDEHG